MFWLALLSGYGVAAADPAMKFEVKSLPGWTAPLPSKQYTGYINAGTPPSGVGTMYFHYWMAESENDPANDPVIFWYNGGPGASSLFGFLQELGPLWLNVDSFDDNYNKTGIPSPVRNTDAWTKFATVVAIDSPAPIGLSYCSEKGPTGDGPSCGPWTDSSVFAANHAAHKSFFNDIFPELKPNPFYIVGESYAGIYVPGFANAMMDDPVPGLNFQGFAVGDGWTGCVEKEGQPNDWCIDLDNVGVFKYPNANEGPWYDIEFFHGHSQFSEELYREIRSQCPEKELRSFDLTDPCLALIDEMAQQVGGWYAYNLYNKCPTDQMGMNRAAHARRHMLKTFAGRQVGGVGDSPCPGTAMPEYLARPEVLEALGVPADINFLNLDNGHGFNYTSDHAQITWIYTKALSQGLKVLIYEGDSDACGLQTAPVEDVFVPFFARSGLNKTREWRPFTTDHKQQMGGFVIEWEDRKAQFVSIRGAGHLVPLNRPTVATTLMQSFMSGTALPEYVVPKPPTIN